MALLVPQVCNREQPTLAHLLFDAEVVLHDVRRFYAIRGITENQGIWQVRGILGTGPDIIQGPRCRTEGVLPRVHYALLICEGERIGRPGQCPPWIAEACCSAKAASANGGIVNCTAVRLLEPELVV